MIGQINGLKGGNMDNLELIKLAHEGDKQARDSLVAENVGLIWSIVKRFTGRGCEIEDLFQIGCIGILKAIDKFDVSYQVQFSTYAVPMISGEIKRFLRDDGIIKVSRSIKENSYKITKAISELTLKLNRDPTIDEISEYTSISREDIVITMEANIEVESIHKTVFQNDGNEVYLLDKLAGNGMDKDGKKTSAYVDVEKENLINNMLIKELMDNLQDAERELIILRYFKDKTQTEVAGIMGVSQVQISRMEKKILLKMRREAV